MAMNLREFHVLHVRPHANGGWSIVGEQIYGPGEQNNVAAVNDDEGLIEWFAEVLGFVDAPATPEKIIEVSPNAFVAALQPILAVAKAVEDEDPDQALLLDAQDANGQSMELNCGDLQRLLHEALKLGMGGADVPAEA